MDETTQQGPRTRNPGAYKTSCDGEGDLRHNEETLQQKLKELKDVEQQCKQSFNLMKQEHESLTQENTKSQRQVQGVENMRGLEKGLCAGEQLKACQRDKVLNDEIQMLHIQLNLKNSGIRSPREKCSQ